MVQPKQRESTGRHAVLVAAGILLTRLIGFARQRIFSRYFGLSDAADAFNIYTGFQGNHVSSLQLLRLIPGYPGTFVDFQADAVTRAMDKVTTQSLALQDISGCRVHLTGADPVLHSVSCSSLRFQDSFVPAANPRRRAPHMHSATEVAAVVAEYSTEVQHDQLVFPDSARRRTRMRQRRPRACRNNGLERLRRSPFSAHSVDDLSGDIKFGDSGPDQTDRFVHDFRSQAGSVSHPVDFE